MREKRERFSPFIASLRQGVLFLELIGLRGNADQFFAIEQGVALRAIERAKRHRLAAVVAVANGFNNGRRGHVEAGRQGAGVGVGARLWNGPTISIFGAPVCCQAKRMPTNKMMRPITP